MAMIQTTVNLVWKFLPLTMAQDGSMSITMTQGYLDQGTQQFNGINTRNVTMPTADVGTMMAVNPDATKSRYEDITTALCQYLLDKGYVTGTIVPETMP